MRTKSLATVMRHAPDPRVLAICFGAWWGMTSAEGAIVAWGAPSNIGGVGDVSLLGNLVEAVNTGFDGNSIPTTVAVNGVTFTGWVTTGNAPVSPGSHFTLTAAPNFTHQGFDGFGSIFEPFNNLPTPYRTLLAGANYVSNQLNPTDFTGSISLGISGLTIGLEYYFQWWTNDSRPFASGPVIATSGGASVALDPNTINAAGGIGQFAVGTFTADATAQVVTFTTTGNVNLQSAFQLRVIPEPSTALLIVTASSILFGNSRRRLRD